MRPAAGMALHEKPIYGVTMVAKHHPNRFEGLSARPIGSFSARPPR